MEPFRCRRRVGFGECDPARIFFAPRAIDYTVEAADGFTEAALGASWAELLRQGREPRVRALDCVFERSVVAGQVIEIAVEVAEVGLETFTLSATAELASGDPSFHTRLVLGLAERGRRDGGSLSPEHRARLSALAARSRPSTPGAGGAPPAARAVRPDLAAAPPPFTRERRVRYGECGPSGEPHASKVVEWAVETVGEWYEEQLGISWLEQCRRGRGTPFLSIRCDTLGRMEAGNPVTLAVSIPRLGRASIEYRVAGRDERGAPCFEVDMTACQITEENGPRRSMPFPEALRERVVAYQGACGGGPARS